MLLPLQDAMSELRIFAKLGMKRHASQGYVPFVLPVLP
jgi:hypothetical protein